MAVGSYSETFGGGGWKGFGEYLATKNARVQAQLEAQHSGDSNSDQLPDQIFQGCHFWLDGRSRVPEAKLKELMVKHGGVYESYDLNSVTHVIADNLAMGNKKWQLIRDKGGSQRFHVVTSEWILACVQKHSRIKETYFVPDAIQRRADGFGTMFKYITEDATEREQKPTPDPLQRTSDVVFPDEDLVLASRQSAGSKRSVLCTDDEPNFVENFLKASRLHFIGTWRERFYLKFQTTPFVPLPAAVTSMGEKSGGTLLKYLAPAAADSKANEQVSEILHVDFDAFFVSVAIRNRPDLTEKPVAVSHGTIGATGGAEIASCNYIARKFGITKGMWLADATKLCPDLVAVPYDFTGFEEASLILFDVLTDITTRVNPKSCDEVRDQLVIAWAHVLQHDLYQKGFSGVSIAEIAFLQLVGPEECRHSVAIARWIRHCVVERTGCTVSIGIGPNALLAKLAGTQAKSLSSSSPADGGDEGICRVESACAFIAQLRLEDLPGIGHRNLEKFNGTDLVSCGDVVKKSSLKELVQILGKKLGENCWLFCHGKDPRPLRFDAEESERTTLTVSINWGIRLTLDRGVTNLLKQMASACEKKLKLNNSLAGEITLKILRRTAGAPVEPAKFGGCGACDELVKRIVVEPPLSTERELFPHLQHLWSSGISRSCSIPDIRGVGVLMSKLKLLPVARIAVDMKPVDMKALDQAVALDEGSRTYSPAHQLPTPVCSTNSSESNKSTPSRNTTVSQTGSDISVLSSGRRKFGLSSRDGSILQAACRSFSELPLCRTSSSTGSLSSPPDGQLMPEGDFLSLLDELIPLTSDDVAAPTGSAERIDSTLVGSADLNNDITCEASGVEVSKNEDSTGRVLSSVGDAATRQPFFGDGETVTEEGLPQSELSHSKLPPLQSKPFRISKLPLSSPQLSPPQSKLSGLQLQLSLKTAIKKPSVLSRPKQRARPKRQRISATAAKCVTGTKQQSLMELVDRRCGLSLATSSLAAARTIEGREVIEVIDLEDDGTPPKSMSSMAISPQDDISPGMSVPRDIPTAKNNKQQICQDNKANVTGNAKGFSEGVTSSSKQATTDIKPLVCYSSHSSSRLDTRQLHEYHDHDDREGESSHQQQQLPFVDATLFRGKRVAQPLSRQRNKRSRRVDKSHDDIARLLSSILHEQSTVYSEQSMSPARGCLFSRTTSYSSPTSRCSPLEHSVVALCETSRTGSTVEQLSDQVPTCGKGQAESRDTTACQDAKDIVGTDGIENHDKCRDIYVQTRVSNPGDCNNVDVDVMIEDDESSSEMSEVVLSICHVEEFEIHGQGDQSSDGAPVEVDNELLYPRESRRKSEIIPATCDTIINDVSRNEHISSQSSIASCICSENGSYVDEIRSLVTIAKTHIDKYSPLSSTDYLPTYKHEICIPPLLMHEQILSSPFLICCCEILPQPWNELLRQSCCICCAGELARFFHNCGSGIKREGFLRSFTSSLVTICIAGAIGTENQEKLVTSLSESVNLRLVNTAVTSILKESSRICLCLLQRRDLDVYEAIIARLSYLCYSCRPPPQSQKIASPKAQHGIVQKIAERLVTIFTHNATAQNFSSCAVFVSSVFCELYERLQTWLYILWEVSY